MQYGYPDYHDVTPRTYLRSLGATLFFLGLAIFLLGVLAPQLYTYSFLLACGLIGGGALQLVGGGMALQSEWRCIFIQSLNGQVTLCYGYFPEGASKEVIEVMTLPIDAVTFTVNNGGDETESFHLNANFKDKKGVQRTFSIYSTVSRTEKEAEESAVKWRLGTT